MFVLLFSLFIYIPLGILCAYVDAHDNGFVWYRAAYIVAFWLIIDMWGLISHKDKWNFK